MAYGAIAAPTQTVELPTLSYTLPDQRRLTCFPVTRSTVPDGVGEYLLGMYNTELASEFGMPLSLDGNVETHENVTRYVRAQLERLTRKKVPSTSRPSSPTSSLRRVY